MSRASLYQRLLGRDFDRLPASLRRFHGPPGGASASGALRVRGSRRPLGRVLARALGLPPEGDGVPAALRVSARGGREVWERQLGASRLRTTQWLTRGRLAERVGVARFLFEVSGDEDGMRFRPAGFSLLGVPLPRALALRVEADVRGGDTHWDVEVVVRAPGLGVITSYRGRMGIAA